MLVHGVPRLVLLVGHRAAELVLGRPRDVGRRQLVRVDPTDPTHEDLGILEVGRHPRLAAVAAAATATAALRALRVALLALLAVAVVVVGAAAAAAADVVLAQAASPPTSSDGRRVCATPRRLFRFDSR